MADVRPAPLTDYDLTPARQAATWSCGWNASTNRCLRFHCASREPCSGYVGNKSAKTAMRGFDALPAAMRAALNEESMPVSKARRLIKNMGERAAVEYVAALPAERLQMQRTFTTSLRFAGDVQ